VVASATLDQLQFRPELNDAVEFGLKYNGRGIDVNVAVFNQLFRDFQLNTFNGLNFFVENINGCKNQLNNADVDNIIGNGVCPAGDLQAGVRSRGIELEAFLRPATDVTVNLGTTLASTRYRNNLVGANGRALNPALFQLPGSRLSNSAQAAYTASIGFNPRITDSGIRALFYVDGRHSSEFNTGSDLDIEKLQSSYTVVNGRIGLQGPGGRWGIELWAQNLLNEDYLQVAFDATLQGSGTRRAVDAGFIPTSSQLFGAFLGEPRTYGVTLRTRM
jgi:hypothetical protein